MGNGVGIVGPTEAILLLFENDQIGDRLQRHKLALAAWEEPEDAPHHWGIGVGGVDGGRRASVAGADGRLEGGKDRLRELPEEDPGAEAVGGESTPDRLIDELLVDAGPEIVMPGMILLAAEEENLDGERLGDRPLRHAPRGAGRLRQSFREEGVDRRRGDASRRRQQGGQEERRQTSHADRHAQGIAAKGGSTTGTRGVPEGAEGRPGGGERQRGPRRAPEGAFPKATKAPRLPALTTPL